MCTWKREGAGVRQVQQAGLRVGSSVEGICGFPVGPLFGLRISLLVVAIKAGQCGHDVSAQQLPVQ